MAMGLFVPREMTFAATLPTELSRRTGRRIELYNEATGGEYRGGSFPLPDSFRQFNQVLSAQPDLILWVITPTDIENLSPEKTLSPPLAAATEIAQRVAPTDHHTNLWTRVIVASANRTFVTKLRNRWEQSTTLLALKHILIESESQDQYVNSYLKNEDDSEFLRIQVSVKWQSSLQAFQACAEEFERQSNAAGVPLVAVLVPNRPQAAMISMGEWPNSYDPYKLDNELRVIIESNGGTYVDILKDFRTVPDPERHYFPVDGHPDADGQAMISEFLTKELTSGAVPPYAPSSPQVALPRAN